MKNGNNATIATYYATIRLIDDFTAQCGKDITREALARTMAETYLYRLEHPECGETPDNGLLGKVFEMLARSPRSRRIYTAPNGTVDGYVDGHPVEFKTNGGRIGSLDGSLEYKANTHKMPKVPYVIYYLDVDNSLGKHHITAKWIPRKEFIEKIEEFNAFKWVSHNGIKEEHQIQSSNRKFWKWLETCEDYFRPTI